jgi:hypothetical protein
MEDDLEEKDLHREFRDSGREEMEIMESHSDLLVVADKTKFFQDPPHIRSDIQLYKQILSRGEKPVGILFQMAEDAAVMIEGIDKDANQNKYIKLCQFYIFVTEKIEERLGHAPETEVIINVQRAEKAMSLKKTLEASLKV